MISVFEVLALYGINVEEMENIVLEGREASIAKMMVSGGNIHNIKEIMCEQITAKNGSIMGAEFI